MHSVLFLPLIFFLVLGIAVLFRWVPPAILAYYAGISLVTFVAYWLDKAAARQGSRRIRENTLHTLSLAGGWPGALIARQRFRHKTRKQPFRFVFWLTVLVNLSMLIWLYSSDTALPLSFTQ